MPARTKRDEARERLSRTFFAALDRIIPADESVPLRGSTFRDWEEQVEAIRRAVLPVVLEERAALDDSARVESGGRCPSCGSDRVYLEKQETAGEVLGPHGPVVVRRQHCRCRSCGRSFSPSGA